MTFAKIKGPLGQKSPTPRKRTSTAPMRQASRGQSCTLRIPGACMPGNETVVGCHVRLPGFAGMGLKPDDLFIIDACHGCHSVLDNRAKWESAACGWDDVLRAMMETQLRRKAAGLITVTE